MRVLGGWKICASAALIAASARPEAAAAQTSSFLSLQPGSGRFVIIGGAEHPRPPAEVTSAKPLRRAAAESATIDKPVPATAQAPAQEAKTSPGLTEAAAPALPALAPDREPEPAPATGAAAAAQPAPAASPAALPAPAMPEPIATGSIATSTARPAAAPIEEANVKIVSAGDSLVNEAVRRARASLDLFIRMASNPPEGASEFAVKVTIGPRHARESVWLTSLERRTSTRFFFLTRERWSGRLSNEPSQLPSHRIGDRLSFDAGDIRDWTYRTSDGRMEGNFTACALTAQEGRAKLADLVEKTRIDCGWIDEPRKTAAR